LQAEVNRFKDQQKADKIISSMKEKEKKRLASDLVAPKRDLTAAKKENKELRKIQRDNEGRKSSLQVNRRNPELNLRSIKQRNQSIVRRES